MATFDRARLREIFGDDAAAIQHVIDLALADLYRLVLALSASVAARDIGAIGRETHEVRGLASNLGITDVVEAAADLNLKAVGGDWQTAESTLEILRREVATLETDR